MLLVDTVTVKSFFIRAPEGVGVIARMSSSLGALVVIDSTSATSSTMSTERLAAELSLTEKNNEPEMKAIRKVRQKVRRAKAVFAMILDCFVPRIESGGLAMT